MNIDEIDRMEKYKEVYCSINETIEHLEIREKYNLRRVKSLFIEINSKRSKEILSVLENILENKNGTMREALVALRKIRDREEL